MYSWNATGLCVQRFIIRQHQWRTRSCKSCGDLSWNLFCLAAIQRDPHNPLLKLLRAHLEGGCTSKYLLYPDTETTRSKALHLIGQGKGEEGSQGTRRGWGRIHDLSIFPFFAAKQDFWLGACRDEWSSYKLVGLKDNMGSFSVPCVDIALLWIANSWFDCVSQTCEADTQIHPVVMLTFGKLYVYDLEIMLLHLGIPLDMDMRILTQLNLANYIRIVLFSLL